MSRQKLGRWTAICIAMCASAGALAADPSADLPPYHVVRRELERWLRQEAAAPTPEARLEAVRRLCELHGRLVRDPRLPRSPTLQGYRARVWRRLVEVKRTAERRMAAAQRRSGGPSSARPGPGAAGGGAVADYGPELVRLIERTISPEFWDTAGGPGAVVYYRPLQSLVVRATTEIHHRVAQLLGLLRGDP